jgi:hypothetical protein
MTGRVLFRAFPDRQGVLGESRAFAERGCEMPGREMPGVQAAAFTLTAALLGTGILRVFFFVQ